MDKSILFAKKLKSKEVTIEGVGTVTIRELSLANRIKLDTKEAGLKGAVSHLALLVCACCFDPEGKPVFSLDDAPQIDEMGTVVLPLVLAAMEVNGEGQKAKDDALKNS